MAALREVGLEVIRRYGNGAVFLFQAFLGHAQQVHIVNRFQHGFVSLGGHHIKSRFVMAEHGDGASARFSECFVGILLNSVY